MVSFTLGILTGEIKDAVDKTIVVLDDSCKVHKGACETSKKTTAALRAQIEVLNTLQ